MPTSLLWAGGVPQWPAMSTYSALLGVWDLPRLRYVVLLCPGTRRCQCLPMISERRARVPVRASVACKSCSALPETTPPRHAFSVPPHSGQSALRKKGSRGGSCTALAI